MASKVLPKKKRKRGQRRCGYCEKRIAVGLRVTGLGCTRFSNERVAEKLAAKSLERNSKSSIHEVYATSREYPGQERSNAWKNTSQTSTSAKSLRLCLSKRVRGERQFEVDSRASMHMVSEKDLNSAESATLRTSRSPTMVMTANGEVRTERRSDSICSAIGLIRQS